MKIYKTQEEVNADLDKKGDLALDCSVTFEFSVVIKGNIKAGDINAVDIKAGNIKAGDINARDIKAGDIYAGDINAGDIYAGNINARDIKAGEIYAGDINAGDIKFFAFCTAYYSIKCKSWAAIRGKHHAPICLDGELIVEQKDGAAKT